MANLPDLHADVKVGFSDLEVAAIKAKLLGDTLKKELGSGTVSKATNDVANGIRNVGNSSSNSTPGIAALGSAIAGAASSLGPMTIGIIVLGAALSPVIVLLSAFTVGLTAAFAVMTLGAGIFAGLAAGAVALAAATGQLGDASGKGAASAADLEKAQANLTAAQKKYGDSSYQAAEAQQKLTALQEQGKGPVAALEDHFHQLADTLGKEVAPAAHEVLDWINAMLDPLAKLTGPLTTWVNSNDRLTNSLDILGQFINDFADSLTNKFGPAIGNFLDQWISRGPTWEALWRETLSKAADAVDGLLTNLLRLTDWFTDRLPTLGPEVEQIMGGIGTVIQGVGDVAGKVADFFIQHWPQITSTVQSVFNDIRTGFNYVLPVLGLALYAFQQLGPVFKFIQDHADSLKPVLYAVGGVLVIMAASAILTWSAIVLLTAGIVAVASALSTVVYWVANSVVPWFGHAGNVFSALGSAANWVANQILYIFEATVPAVYWLSYLAGWANTVQGIFWGVVNAAWATANAIWGVINAARNVPALGGIINAILPGFAQGGVAIPGQAFVVGEDGPELAYAVPGGGVIIQPGGPNMAAGGAAAAATSPGPVADFTSGQTLDLLASIDRRLAVIQGQPGGSALLLSAFR